MVYCIIELLTAVVNMETAGRKSYEQNPVLLDFFILSHTPTSLTLVTEVGYTPVENRLLGFCSSV